MKNNDNYNRVFVDFDEFKEEIKNVDRMFKYKEIISRN